MGEECLALFYIVLSCQFETQIEEKAKKKEKLMKKPENPSFWTILRMLNCPFLSVVLHKLISCSSSPTNVMILTDALTVLIMHILGECSMRFIIHNVGGKMMHIIWRCGLCQVNV